MRITMDLENTKYEKLPKKEFPQQMQVLWKRLKANWLGLSIY